jgi:hypothetical protein
MLERLYPAQIIPGVLTGEIDAVSIMSFGFHMQLNHSRARHT